MNLTESMLLYAVTDRAWTGKLTLLQQIEQALEGGATCIQLREKELDTESFLHEALEVRSLCRRFNVPFIINDNVEVAIKCRADGIHIGQHDMETKKARMMIGHDMILGVSAQTVEQALKAQNDGADYLGVGAVFPTGTKQDADDVKISTLQDICNAVSIPVVAIGGISKKNMKQLKGSGIDGVAVVSAIFAQNDIKTATADLLSEARRLI
ncbi:MAG: thiamine phosphate synthase [Spirochaetia bacterium]|nr:thiamine phosphate synthase [Spirochaetia bacterium]